MSRLRTRSIVAWLGRWLPLAVWAALIFAVSSWSSLPAIGTGTRLPVSQIGHFTEYAVLAFLLFRALGRREATATLVVKVTLISLALSLVYALGDEFHQSFVPNRDSSLADVGIDAAGAGVGLLVAVAWLKLRVRARG